jgi:hypothetical protein
MEYVTPMHLAMAIPLTIAATYACMKVKRKLEEKIPGTPLLSPEEHKQLREQTLCFTIMPHEQETIHKS